ncbi:MAG: hypothetical protein MI892_25395, partial [Desulfobacterales bacterium]|nr:hypothetical protein [Desulfobacterales bacterium]
TNIDVVLTDFNTQGASSASDNKQQQLKEINQIYNETILSRFIPDYEFFNRTSKEMEVYKWAKSKKILNAIIVLSYTIARKLNNSKKSSG